MVKRDDDVREFNQPERRDDYVAQMNRIENQLDNIQGSIADINHAFPAGPEAHRQVHEAMIAAAKAEEDFWRELKLDMARKGLWGLWSLIVIILGLAILGFSTKFGIDLNKFFH